MQQRVLFLLLILCSAFVACSDDDDGPSVWQGPEYAQQEVVWEYSDATVVKTAKAIAGIQGDKVEKHTIKFEKASKDWIGKLTVTESQSFNGAYDFTSVKDSQIMNLDNASGTVAGLFQGVKQITVVYATTKLSISYESSGQKWTYNYSKK